jgi:hypothetical protein
MIKHIVLFDLPPEYDREELASIIEGVHELRKTISGFTHFEYGTNKNFEGMSADWTHVFICHFADENTSRAFLVDPGHNALGQRLVNICRGGVKGISVVDMAIA